MMHTYEKYRINIPSPESRISLNLCINEFQKPTAFVVNSHWTGCIQSLIAIVSELFLFISLFNSTICSYFFTVLCSKIEQKFSLRIRMNHLIIIPSIVNATNRQQNRTLKFANMHNVYIRDEHQNDPKRHIIRR